MSYRREMLGEIPEETSRVAKAAFPKGNIYMTMRDELGLLLEDAEFQKLYSRLGQPGLSAWRLLLITILQFTEGLTDRQTAESVRGRIDWKYLLGLELSDAGFDFSALSEFRDRLVDCEAADYFLDELLKHFKAIGLLKHWKQQRTDSMHVVGNVRILNQVELVGEGLRAVLNALATVASDWLRNQVQPEWYERYGLRLSEWRLPRSATAREALAVQIAQDGYALLSAIYASTAPGYLREIPVVKIMRQIWVQQFMIIDGQVSLRGPADQPSGHRKINSPYETQVRWSQKHEMWWLGYKVHFTETCAQDDLHLITHVETTPASTVDYDSLPRIHQRLDAQTLLPTQHLVDAGYVEAQTLVESQQNYGVDLIGPAHSDRTWQAQANLGFDISNFQIDWVHEQVRCPTGQLSSVWQPTTGRLSQPIISVRFATATCRDCPVRTLCTTQKTRGRRLSLQLQPFHEALQAARTREKTQDFKKIYARRSGVESTFSQGVRAFDLRRSRYRGLLKTHVQHVFSAIAINLVRVFTWLTQPKDAPPYVSPFAAMAP